VSKKQDYTYRGRPAHYNDPKELWEKAVEYFKSVTTTSGIIRATISGVTRHCGFASRTAWHDYAKKSEEFKNTVDMIKMVVIEWYERNLHGYNWAGSAFALRNMDGGNWKDETHEHVNQVVTTVNPTVVSSGTPLANKEEDIQA
jgi:hypothetical protein